MVSKRQFKGIWLPRELYLNTELTWTEKILLIEIDSLDNSDKGCYASNKYLGEFLNKSSSTIANTISRLIRLGYLKRIFFDGHNRGLRINKGKSCFKYYSEPYQKKEGNLTEKSKEPYRKKEHKDTINKQESINVQFLQFWTGYNLKVKRKRSLSLWGSLSDQDRKQILIILPNYMKQYVNDNTYQPHPSTFLNGRLWEDEITIKSKKTPNQPKYKTL